MKCWCKCRTNKIRKPFKLYITNYVFHIIIPLKLEVMGYWIHK